MCQVLTHCGFSGVSPDGNCAYVHWGSFTSNSRSVRRAIWFMWYSEPHECIQHLAVPDGHPSNYEPGATLLNFSDRADHDERTPYCWLHENQSNRYSMLMKTTLLCLEETYIVIRGLNIFTSIISSHHFIYVSNIYTSCKTEHIGQLYIIWEWELRTMHDQNLLIQYTSHHITTTYRKFMYFVWKHPDRVTNGINVYYPNYHIYCILSCCNSVPNNL